MKNLIVLLLVALFLTGCSSEVITEEAKDVVEVNADIEFYERHMTINDVMAFVVPENWVSVDSYQMSDDWLPLSEGPGWYDFEVYSSESDLEPDYVSMLVEWLDSEVEPDNRYNSFYSEDERFSLYEDYPCEVGYKACFTLIDLGTYYYSINFNYEQVGDSSVDLSWDLDWLESVRTPSGAPIDEFADYYNVDKPEHESELVRYLLMLPEEVLGDHIEQSIVDSIDVLDEENYYLHMYPYGLDGDASFAVFLYQDSPYLVFEMKGCGPMCHQSVYVYEMAPYGLNDVTEYLLPELDFTVFDGDFDSFNPMYELPRYSTTIEVRDQMTDTLLYNLYWADGRFEAELSN
jgi:hypothetical protein